MTTPAGAWGPVASGGPGRHWPRRVAIVVVGMLAAAATALAAVGNQAVRAAQENIEVVGISGLEEAADNEPLHVLIVGSDARGELTDQQRQELQLGTFDGQRSDTVILASVSADRSNVSLLSFPRDTVVGDTDGGIAKLSETYGAGREELVEVVREDLGFPVNHYVEVSITGFISTVDVVGGVRMCLDESLVDPASGADFAAGCQEFTPEEALAYVRSRQGDTGDLQRIERQQQFLRAMLARIIDLRLLLDPGRLVDIAEEVSSEVTTDDQLPVSTMVRLGQDLRGAVGGGIEMVTLPVYPEELRDGGVTKKFVIAYEPGLRALRDAIENGEALPTRGDAEERPDVALGVWTTGPTGAAGVVESTLLFGGFDPQVLGTGPLETEAVTRVFAAPGATEQAGWVAAHLGTSVVDPPPGVELPDGLDVVVAVGEDAVPAQYP